MTQVTDKDKGSYTLSIADGRKVVQIKVPSTGSKKIDLGVIKDN